MDAKEFIACVQAAGRELPSIAIKEATDHYLKTCSKPYGDAQKRHAVELAGRFAAHWANEQSSNGKDSRSLMLSDSVIGSEILCNMLEPQINDIRREIFGSAKVPFPNDAAAIKWIEAQRPQSAQELSSVSTILRASQKSAEAQRKFLVLRKQIEALTGYEVHYSRRFYSYPNLLTGAIMPQIPIMPGRGDKLHILTRACKNMAENHGFNAALVSWWILRGLRPIQPRVVVSRIARPLGPPATLVTINGVLNLTWRESWEVFGNIQKKTGIKRRAQSVYQYKIRQLVESRGGVPEHGSKTEFWESIRLEIKKEFGMAPGTWQAIRKSFFASK
jgi:hypothetical protein